MIRRRHAIRALLVLALIAAPLGLAMFIANSARADTEFWLVLIFLALLIAVLFKFSPRDRDWMAGENDT